MNAEKRDDSEIEPDGGIQKVVVLGGGSAALLAVAALVRHLPDIEVVTVRSSKIGIIGVGEGTIATIGRFLHDYLGIDPLRFHREVHPSIKLGIQFIWGAENPYHYSFAPQFSQANPAQSQFPRPVGDYCQTDATYASLASSLMYHGNVTVADQMGNPIQSPRFAYHLENKRFVRFLETLMEEQGVETIDAIVEDVEIDEQGVKSLRLDDGQTLTADLFLDCSGFRSELLGTALQEPFVSFKDALPCDRAVVGGWKRTDDVYHAFTTAEAMDSGWSWQIEHDDLVNRGYVFASEFISDDDAESEFRARNPKVVDTRVIRFRSGFHRRSWVKNVVAIGNSAGFVEPLEATAIGFMSTAIDNLVAFIRTSGGYVADVHRDLYNRHQEANWLQTRDFLAMHYKVNRLSQSEFWEACRQEQPLGDAQEILDYYTAVGPDFRALQPRLRTDVFGAEGYLSILVGQRVPYRRQAEPSRPEWEAWARWKGECELQGKQGVGMSEYLDRIRRGDLRLRFGQSV